jgi:hypothetical protein
MANAYGNTTKMFSTPYITIAEYKQAPTAVDLDNLVVYSSDPLVQDAELTNVIARASSYIDTYCNQVLSATTETEQQRARLRPDGFLAIHPRYNPVVAVTSLSYGVTPTQMVAYPDPSVGWVEDQQFILPYTAANISYSSQGPLQFGMPAMPRQQVFCQYTYVNGYANTLIAATTTVGATSLTVKDGTGIVAGSRLTIFDGKETETIVVGSGYTFGSTTVPVTAPMAYAHSAGDAISALPPAIKQACILTTTAFLKARGDNGLTMQITSTIDLAGTGSGAGSDELSAAKELLLPFRRMR